MTDNPDAAKQAILTGHKVNPTKDLTEYQLCLTIRALREVVEKKEGVSVAYAALDSWRKKVMAAIGQYLYLKQYKSDAAIIKGIACRQSGAKEFNKMTKEQLRNCYYLFVNKNKSMTVNVDNFIVGNQFKLIHKK